MVMPRETKEKCKSGRSVAEMGRITPLQDRNSEHFDLRNVPACVCKSVAESCIYAGE